MITITASGVTSARQTGTASLPPDVAADHRVTPRHIADPSVLLEWAQPQGRTWGPGDPDGVLAGGAIPPYPGGYHAWGKP